MLTALENGVKGGVWFSLMDKVYAPKNLRAAWKQVERNGGAAGIDQLTVGSYERNKTESAEVCTKIARRQVPAQSRSDGTG